MSFLDRIRQIARPRYLEPLAAAQKFLLGNKPLTGTTPQERIKETLFPKQQPVGKSVFEDYLGFTPEESARRNIFRGTIRTLDTPSRALGSILKAKQERKLGEKGIFGAAKEGVFAPGKKGSIFGETESDLFSQVPKATGTEGTPLGFLLGMGAEIATPDPTDLAKLGKVSKGVKGVDFLSGMKKTPEETFERFGKEGTDFFKRLSKEAEDVTPDFLRPKEGRTVAEEAAEDIASFRRAETDIVTQDPGRVRGFLEPVTKLGSKVGGRFKDWVNLRSAAKLEGNAVQDSLSHYDELGQEGMFRFQEGEKGFDDARNYFDNKFNYLKEKGINLGYRDNYLPQVWEESHDVVRETFNRIASTKPSFTAGRLFDDYRAGIEAGLTPKFRTIGELANWYERTANRAVANKDFIGGLLKEGYITTSGKAPRGWVALNPDVFPQVYTSRGNLVYKAPPELAEVINNYLVRSRTPVLSEAADMARLTKNLVLSFGVPKTAINFHGFNTLARSVMADKNPIGALARGLGWMVMPNQAEKFVLSTQDDLIRATKAGLKVSAEEKLYKEGTEVVTGLGKGVKKYTGLLNTLFEEPLFDKMIPAMKITYFRQLEEEFLKFLPEDEAAKKAAEIVNNMFGGINADALGRSQAFKDVLSAIVLAPDWAETQFRLGKNLSTNIIKGGTAESKAYRRIARNLLLTVGVMELTNKTLSGHWMHENEPGRKFDIDTGIKDSQGQTVYIRALGTAADFIRVPVDVVTSIAQGGDTRAIETAVRNRLSVPLGTTLGQLANVDWRGKPIIDPTTQSVPEQFLRRGVEVGKTVFPAPARAGIDLLSGRVSPEEAVAQSVELPVRFSEKPEVPGFWQFAQKKRAEKTRESAQLEKQATQELGKVKKFKTPDEKKQYILDLASTDPELVEEMEKLLEEEAVGLTSVEKRLKYSGVANQERAELVIESLKRIKDLEKKKETIERWVEIGIITPKVEQQMLQLLEESK